MNAWLDWGLPLIVWLQSLGPGLAGPMRLLSFAGNEEFFLIVMPAFLWCFDVRLGIRLGLILVGSALVNTPLKLAFGWPRPYWVSERVLALSSESSFGLPSGHAQNALAVWGRLAEGLRRRSAAVLLGVLIVLISVSRVHLGVHYPADMLAGWAVGGALLYAFVRGEAAFVAWMRRFSVPARLGWVAVAALALLLLSVAVHAATAGRPLPEAWAANAAAAAPAADPIDPRSLDGAFANAGLLFGIGAGAVLLTAWGGFDAGGPPGKKLARYVIGLLGVAALWMGLRLIFPRGDDLVSQLLRMLRYGLLGLWAAYLAPRLFVRLKLA